MFDYDSYGQIAHAEGLEGVQINTEVVLSALEPFDASGFAKTLILSLKTLKDAKRDFDRLYNIALMPGIDQKLLRNAYLDTFGTYLGRAGLGFLPIFYKGPQALLLSYLGGEAMTYLLQKRMDVLEKSGRVGRDLEDCIWYGDSPILFLDCIISELEGLELR
jgi:hypothetical protein